MQSPESLSAPPHYSESQAMTIAQLILSGLGLVIALLAAAGLAIYGLSGIFSRASDLKRAESTFALAWIGLFMALLAVPSLVLCVQRLRFHETTQPTRRTSSFRLASLGLGVWALVLALGSLISRNNQVAWLLLPPLQLLTVSLPVWWLYEFARRSLSIGSAQRGWGIINFGMFVTTPLIMVIEIVVMVGLIFVFAVWASLNGAMLQSLQNLAEQIGSARGNPQALLSMLLPYLQNPVLIFAILAVVAGVMPMIEELVKPLALWVFAGQHLTPAQGFVGGALSGAAFALIESLFYLSTPVGESWFALAIGRTGTCLLHITTAALVGWAMANAWHSGAYLRLGATYLLAVALHGLWNGLSIISGLAAILNPLPASLVSLVYLSRAAPFILAALVLLFIILLWANNRVLALTSSSDPVRIF